MSIGLYRGVVCRTEQFQITKVSQIDPTADVNMHDITSRVAIQGLAKQDQAPSLWAPGSDHTS